MDRSLIQTLSGGEELLPQLELLWLKLKDYHIDNFKIWSDSLRDGNFSDRVTGLRDAADNGAILVEIAQDGTTPIAFCISVIDKEGIGEVASLFVDQAYRNKGIALRLLESSLQWLKEHHASPIVVDVMAGNAEALQLYEKVGFAQRVHRLQFVEQASN